MPIPARAAAMRLTVLVVGLLTCQAIRTPRTLNVPTHYTRSRPCVLETPQYDICHVFNRVHARWLPTPTKILPKSLCLTSQGTFPWSHSLTRISSDSGYPKDTGVNKPWQPLRIPFAITPIGQFHQSPPSPIPVLVLGVATRNDDYIGLACWTCVVCGGSRATYPTRSWSAYPALVHPCIASLPHRLISYQ